MSEKTRDDILDQIAKVKAIAEGKAQGGTAGEQAAVTAEAEAAAALLAKLLIRHKVSMAELDAAGEVQVQEPVGLYGVDYEAGGARVRGSRVLWIERLSAIIARAYFCRILVQPGSSRVTLVGKASDAKVAEYMIVTMIRLADKLSIQAMDRFWNKCKAQGDTSPAKGYVASWLHAFVMRLAERLEAARKSESSCTALMVVNKAEQDVADFMTEHFGKGKKAQALQKGFTRNAHGYRDGRAAADRVALHANALNSGSGGPRQAALGAGQ